MSMTPAEMLTQRSGVQAAEGTVVLGGLGLGWLLRKVCEKQSVERVIVVEQSQELLD
jgi:spermidine synthase